MNRFASGSHRTGHPRWVQFIANAMNSLALIRRSHAAVSAVTPAHASGEGSLKLTFTVWPILKLSTLPTDRHTSGNRLTSGPIRNPTIGTATSSDTRPIATMLTLVMKTRRSGLNASFEGGGVSVAMHEFSNPVVERDREQHAAGGAERVRADEPEEHEGNSERHHRGLICGRGDAFRLRHGPAFVGLR